VYIPLGGSRVSKLKIVRNTFVIFLLSGFWHGANWTFVVWGAFHALLFLPLILLGKNRKYTDVIASGRVLPSLKEIGQMLVTFLMVVIGWIIFRADDMTQAWGYLCGLCDTSLFTMPFIYVGTKRNLLFVFVMLIVEWFSRKKEHALQYGDKFPSWLAIIISLSLILVMLEFATNSQSFIYFQF
jgi:D-alanyl-lipoteichoic acid acyltransferase DltB (MBOAT superfamily)